MLQTPTISTDQVNKIPYPNNSFSETQAASIPIVPKISGFLSFVSSLAIIWDNISTKTRRKRINTNKRLLLGLSFFDTIQSFCHICSSWPVPKFASEMYSFIKFNNGNQTTCNIQGFFLLFSGAAVPIYNAFLCVYYLICVKSHQRQKIISLRVEPFFHIIAIVYPLFLATFSLINQSYNATATTCFVVEYPKRCVVESYGVSCIRGEKAIVSRKLVTITIGICFTIITISLSALYHHVRKQEERMNLYATHQYTRRDSAVISLNRSNNRSTSSNQSMKQSRRVLRQSFYYVIPFLIVWVPTILQIVTANLTQNPVVAYITILIAGICAPLQGLFNAIIYFKDRLVKRFSSKTSKPAIDDKDEKLDNNNNNNDDELNNINVSAILNLDNRSHILDEYVENDVLKDIEVQHISINIVHEKIIVREKETHNINYERKENSDSNIFHDKNI